MPAGADGRIDHSHSGNVQCEQRSRGFLDIPSPSGVGAGVVRVRCTRKSHLCIPATSCSRERYCAEEGVITVVLVSNPVVFGIIDYRPS
jgi:hypothetical protein